MRTFALAVAALVSVALTGCATPMSVATTPPGADVTVDGRPVGKSPVTTELPSGGGPVMIKAKLGDKEASKTVQRDGTNWGVVGAGAGAGVGTFCAAWGCSAAIGILVPPLTLVTVPIGCIGCASLVGMPAGAYFMWGAKPPEQVTVDIAGAPSTLPPPPAPTSDAPPEPSAPTDGTPPPPPPDPLPY